jgi:hypothetical protein
MVGAEILLVSVAEADEDVPVGKGDARPVMRLAVHRRADDVQHLQVGQLARVAVEPGTAEVGGGASPSVAALQVM